MSTSNIFVVPVLDRFLVYAPLHYLSLLVDKAALRYIQQHLSHKNDAPIHALHPSIQNLATTIPPYPEIRYGPLQEPSFLGLIVTRGCNMGCHYCDFAAPKNTSPIMPLKLAKAAIDAYFALLLRQGETLAKIHFFGGEPFFAAKLIRSVVDYASACAAANGLTVHFEATSNGLYSTQLCHWIASHFHSLVLSLDGPEDIQNRHRPGLNGQGLFQLVARNAKILSEGRVELILRACVTAETVTRLPEIARWISQEFQPMTVCLETLTSSPLSLNAGMTPPDPWEFARQFIAAAAILASHNIQTILSTADTSVNRATFCPVGQDALIVTPEGQVNACYLLAHDWQRQGLDLHLGQLNINQTQFDLTYEAITRVRQLNVYQKALCTDCMCRYHCAGGCHVNHNTQKPPGQYDDLCVQTRLITIANLLQQLNQPELVKDWLADSDALAQTVWQPTDNILDVL